MQLRLLNSLARRVEEVLPGNPDGILRMYHCGPTVYGPPHLGNLRRFLVADLLVRGARFLGYRVRSVMNITDVGHLLEPTSPSPDDGAGPAPLAQNHAGQDRLIVAAQREGLSPEQIAAKYAAEFFAALASLRAEPADYYPRATMHIPQMQAIITRLLAKGLAYATSSGVYFDVMKFPDYGKLSGNTLDAIQAGARADAREDKRHPADFALWVKAPAAHLMQWDSPWGQGYPGWHIECSAMSMQLLGESIDIHSGGADNRFPHHENEIAQSEGATGKPFVKVWVHNEFLEIGDPSTLRGGSEQAGSGQVRKMSKSEGETLTLKELTERDHDALAFRLLCLQTHYRSKLHFSWESLDAATAALQDLKAFVRRLRAQQSAAFAPVRDLANTIAKLEDAFTTALADDLGSPQALAALFDFVRALNPRVEAGSLAPEEVEAIRVSFRKLDAVLALLDVDAPLPSLELPSETQRLVAEREGARQSGDFARADRLREEIHTHGYLVEDTPAGPRVRPA